MRIKAFVIVMMITLFFFIGANPATAQGSENEQLRTYYKNYILKCISKNQSKTRLQASKSANLRSCGALSKQKVIFLTNNQNVLVNEMIKNQIGKKPYKIEYYLNKKFYEMYQ